VHSLDIQSNHVCGLCHVPSRAGKTKRVAQEARAAQEAGAGELCVI